MAVGVKNLSYAFPNKSLFKDLNWEFPRASLTLIRGPSGCGKSTFLKLVAGLLPLQHGEITRANLPAARIGYLHQDCHLVEHWSLAENFALVTDDVLAEERWLERFDLRMPRRALVRQLSGGERQRVSLIRLFLQNPALALLDEPTAHLDDEHTEAALKWIKTELGTQTVLIVSHDKRLLDYADRVLDWRREVRA